MHIKVVSDTDMTDLVRAYAEYRVFATLARVSRALRGVQVSVKAAKNCEKEGVVCSVTVELDPSGTGRTQVKRPHPNDAIDRAADRIGYLVERRMAGRVSS